MLVELIALLHDFVHIYLILRLNDRLSADRTGIVMISPAQQAFDMKNVVDVAQEWHYRVVIFEINEADGALMRSRGCGGLALHGRNTLLVQAYSTKVGLEFEQDSAHGDRVYTQVD